MNIDLSGKVALVTGGGRGIGRACALALAASGAQVAINYSASQEASEEVKAEIEKAGGRAECYQADVSSFEQVEAMFEKEKEDFGTLDILVNNAGVIKDTLLLRMKPADWDKVIGVSLNGVYNCTKMAAEIMMRARTGCVVNISSIIGIMSGGGQTNYAAAKAGVISFTRACAAEMSGRGLRFNAVLPGMIETDMSEVARKHAGDKIMERIPSKRFGQPEDIAGIVVFLSSSASSYINGEAITVDGGMHIG